MILADLVGIPIEETGFCSLVGEAREKLWSISQMQDREPEEVIQREGEPALGIYIVCHGVVKLSMAARRPEEFELGCAASMIGLLGVMSGSTYLYTATVLVPSLVDYISRKDFLAFIGQYPKAAEAVATLRYQPHTILANKGVWAI